MELFIFWLFCAIAAAAVASSKGRTGLGWFLLGVFFGIFALIVVAVMPSLKPVQVVAAPTPRGDGQNRVPCPKCRELIVDGATVCRFCGNDVTPTYSGSVPDRLQPSRSRR